MRRAVDLDDQPRFPAREVGEIWTDRLLPRELPAADLAIAKISPDPAFRAWRISAERASAPGFVDARASYGLPPAFAASLGPSPGLVWGLFCQEENAFVEAVFFLLEGIERGCG